MTIKEFIEKLGAIYGSNPVTEETKIDVLVIKPFPQEKDTDGCIPDIEASINEIDYDFKTDTLTIMCEED